MQIISQEGQYEVQL